MFEKSRDRKAMLALGAWLDGNTAQMHGFEMLPTEPAPMLLLANDGAVVFITVKDGQYTLCLDVSGTPGSIPTWQILGPLGTPPAQVVDRMVSTLTWYIEEAGRVGNTDREVLFSKALRWVGKGLKLVQVETKGFYTVLNHTLAQGVDNPTSLNGLYETSKRLGQPHTTAIICFEQGQAVERAVAAQDSRFSYQGAIQYYTRTLEMTDALGMPRSEGVPLRCLQRMEMLERM